MGSRRIGFKYDVIAKKAHTAFEIWPFAFGSLEVIAASRVKRQQLMQEGSVSALGYLYNLN